MASSSSADARDIGSSSDSGAAASPSFALDALRSLGAHLDALERSAAPHAASSSNDASRRVLDLNAHHHAHPAPHELHALLTASIQPALALARTSTDTDTDTDTLFALTRIALAAYTARLDALLAHAHALERAAWRWHDIHDDDNHLAALSYLLQTLPARALRLGHLTVRLVRASSASALHASHASTPSLLSRETIHSALDSLRKSPALVTASLFPFAASAPDAEPASTERNSTRTKTTYKTAYKLIRAPRVFDPVRLAAHEAKSKAQLLTAERDLVAAQIGTLAQLLPTLTAVDESKSQVQSEDAARAALQIASRAVRQIQSTLPASDDAADDEQQASVLSSTPAPLAETPSPLEIYDALDILLRRPSIASTASYAHPTSLSDLRALGPPSLLLQLWLPAILLPTSALVLRSTLRAQWQNILRTAADARETIRGFWLGWVVQPALQLLETLRRGENERGLIIAKASLASDLASLERMVTSFSADKYKLSPPEVELLSAQVKDGDLTSVLRVYEDEMRSPLRSALTGSLLRALLIQVQKAKVDLEVAMSGIDRLLRSQELLIGAVGLAPALGILWVSLRWAFGRGLGWGRSARSKEIREGEGMRLRAWEAMREIDRLLSLPPASAPATRSLPASSSSNDTLPPLTHGLLLLHLSFLRSAAAPLTTFYARHSPQHKATAKRLRRAFLADIRELEAVAAAGVGPGRSGAAGSEEGQARAVGVGLGWQVRRATMQRMWVSWQGLLLPRGVGM